MNKIPEIKSLLLEILESAFQGNDILATQQMGVNLTNAVKRDGVVIIQNQNVEVYKNIMPAMVKALRLCDAIDIEQNVEPIKQLAAPVENPILECCKYFYENEVGWQEMQDAMKSRYMQYVIDRSKTKVEAAKFLKVGATYLCKLSKMP